ncbi:MAG: saccharopine dehydrogenase NADP-binding domain-containing protein [Proteobacteria bacterium]|nr:saccharopine dehydrogenase NADP-binding domain-containing protein [Pseudomonadota bacterium]
MKSKIIVFGATGYTGHLVAEAMVNRGLKPVLCGRNRQKLERLAEKLGGLGVAVADVNDPASIGAVLEPNDILISTVGPFAKYGKAAITAAVEKGAVYIDSTGEPSFIQQVFEVYGPTAQATGATLITACGYDYIPGNCAAGLAIEASGTMARRVDVGYFSKSGGRVGPLDMSQGTQASLLMAMVAPITVWTKGAYKQVTGGTTVRTFQLDNLTSPGLSMSCTEHFSLPRVYPHLRDIRTYLGWFGKKTYMMKYGAMMQSITGKIPGYLSLMSWLLSFLPESKGKGPNLEQRQRHTTHVIAETFDENGNKLNRTDLVGADGYTFTAEFIAWAADQSSKGGLLKKGAVGPIEAFGLDALRRGCEQCGLTVISVP